MFVAFFGCLACPRGLTPALSKGEGVKTKKFVTENFL